MMTGKRKAEDVAVDVDKKRIEIDWNLETKEDFDDLPVAFPLPKFEEKFKKGDLLFAQYPKYPYWPALFYCYIQKKRQKKPKAYVFFFDELSDYIDNSKIKKKVIPVNVDKIKRFSCSDRNELIEGGKDHKDFVNGMEQAEEYMRKRALGKINDIFEYEVEETLLSDDEDSQGTEKKSPPSELVFENTKKPYKTLLEISSKNTEMAMKIMSWIRNFSRSFLNDVTNGKIKSRRHHIFRHGKQKDKDKLRWYSGFGELNDSSANEILSLLVSWFAEDFPVSEYKAISYVTDVWLPEAYIHALSQIKDILPQDAEIEYLK